MQSDKEHPADDGRPEGEDVAPTASGDPAEDETSRGEDEVVVEDDGSVEIEVPDDGPEDPSQEAETPAEPVDEEQPGSGPMSLLAHAVLALQEQVNKEHDRLMRTAADAENFRKRSRRDLKDAVIRAEDKVVCGFLPVIDNLQRALTHADGHIGDGPEDEKARGLMDGVKMVHKQFVQALERHGIHPFESLGEPFDPELHEAIQQMPSEHPVNCVALELHQGYRRDGGRLVRPAMVAVSLGPPKNDQEPAEETTDGAEVTEPELEVVEPEAEAPEARDSDGEDAK